MTQDLTKLRCVGCGIPLSDGCSSPCKTCAERKRRRLSRGEILSPTGYPGERIDNRTETGRIVASA
jgi:hypothetical protein